MREQLEMANHFTTLKQLVEWEENELRIINENITEYLKRFEDWYKNRKYICGYCLIQLSLSARALNSVRVSIECSSLRIGKTHH